MNQDEESIKEHPKKRGGGGGGGILLCVELSFLIVRDAGDGGSAGVHVGTKRDAFL